MVVADARIDNRGELGAIVDLGSSVDEVPAAELILRAYQVWGSAAPKHLIGDFAFAIWDGTRQTLLCARDPIGARPFCYHLSDRVFVFASEIKALFCHPEIPRELDEVQVAYFLDNFLDDPQRTFYRKIQRLPAAHILEVSPDGVRLERYWSPDPSREVRYSSEGQYVEEFRELFLEAVRCRVRNVDPVGSALSGGLDSSSVVRAARLALPGEQPVHAFSAVFPGLPEVERASNDESMYIDAVANADGIVSHKVRADEVAPLADYDRVLGHFDFPPLAFNLYMHWALFAAAQSIGVRVFLEGTDGDSVVSKGYERFIDLANKGDWETIVEEVMALTVRYETTWGWFPNYLVYPQLQRLARSGHWRNWLHGSSAMVKDLGRSRRKLFLRYGIGAFVPNRLLQWYRYRGQEEGPKSLIREEFARRVRLEEREMQFWPDTSPAQSAREDHARVLALPRYQFALELIDNTAAPFGIEPRYPFFDRRLVEFCIAIPSAQKLAGGWTRLIQRRAMEGILPSLVQWRVHKGRLGFNFIRGMREIEAPKLGPVLFDDPSLVEEFLDMEVVRAAHQRLISAGEYPEAEHDAMLVYKATVLARWLREHGVGA